MHDRLGHVLHVGTGNVMFTHAPASIDLSLEGGFIQMSHYAPGAQLS